jgi:EAL domain-containing protein (putative c-di-GMP-specific phosphodiesterase class I)
VADALLRQARQSLRANGRELRLRVHAGYIDCVGAPALDAPTALRRAEAAAREARHQGLATPHPWRDELGARLLGDLELASAMRQAVEQADFRLVFQPQVRMDRGEPFGVEALIRWNMPGGVSVAPSRFVALAEESGLIDDIGSWSLREACRQAMAWEEQGMRLRVAVNISPRQALQPRFAETVRQALAESGFPGDRLMLELSEATLLRQADGLTPSLEAIRTLGVEIAVDDFGAGLTTLASLRSLPITEIKIDRSFVRTLPGAPEDRLAVETVLRLARQMGLRTMAVGVENAAQWAWLKEQGCDAAQGWLIGKPVEASELAGTIGTLRRSRGQFAPAAAAV